MERRVKITDGLVLEQALQFPAFGCEIAVFEHFPKPTGFWEMLF
jgi:hypothetical protein